MSSANPVYYYSTDPGLEVLLGHGPAINVVRELAQAIRFAGGGAVVGVVGAVVNDRGRTNEAHRVKVEEISTLYGGFKPWLGDGLDARGASAGYNGNLAAQIEDLSAPAWVLCVPNLEVRDGAGTPVLLTLSRSAGTYGTFVLPAGTRIRAVGGYTVATLEPVTWEGDDTTAKAVRVRQVSATTVAPVAMNTVTTFVDAPDDSNVEVDVATVATVPELVDAAEVTLRYGAAFDAFNNTLAGGSASIMVCDRTESGILDLLSTHAVTSTSRGYFRLAVGSPPIGTTASVAQGAVGDGIGRATLDRSRFVYVHPGWRRTYLPDRDNLTAPAYLATLPAAMLAAARIALEVPEQNPARPHSMFARAGFAGVEVLATSPDPVDHWRAGIMQPILDTDTAGGVVGSFYAGILGDGSEIADLRFEDFITRGCIVRGRPYHKRLASARNRSEAVEALSGFLQKLQDDDRLNAFAVSLAYDGETQQGVFSVAAQTPGNMNVLTFRTLIGPSVAVKTA